MESIELQRFDRHHSLLEINPWENKSKQLRRGDGNTDSMPSIELFPDRAKWAETVKREKLDILAQLSSLGNSPEPSPEMKMKTVDMIEKAPVHKQDMLRRRVTEIMIFK